MKKIIFLIALLLCPQIAFAKGKGLSLFLDAEIYEWVQTESKPLLQAAGISPSVVSIYIANSPEVNAFATHNNIIVLHAGLLLKAENENEVLGVIAHEIGHLKAKHHVKSHVQQRKQRIPAIIGTILGIGAAASGAADAAQGLILGGLSTSQSQALKHSRTHEWEADKIGIQTLYKAKITPEGLASFFEKLRQDQLIYSKNPPAYLLTHPLSSARLSAINADIAKHGLLTDTEKYTSPLPAETFKRIQTKLLAFTQEPKKTLRILGYNESAEDLLGKSIAHALLGDTETAINLLKQDPNWAKNPFNWAYLGALQLDLPNLEAARASYRKALESYPQNAVLMLSLAEVEINSKHYNSALHHLNKLTLLNPEDPQVYHLLGVAYGYQKKFVESHLALAQKELYLKRPTEAHKHLLIAQGHLIEKPNEAQKKRLEALKNETKALK